jgi:hypothetical protein
VATDRTEGHDPPEDTTGALLVLFGACCGAARVGVVSAEAFDAAGEVEDGVGDVDDAVGAVTDGTTEEADDLPGSDSATATVRAPADTRAPAAAQPVTRDTRRSPLSRSNSLFIGPVWGATDKPLLRPR